MYYSFIAFYLLTCFLYFRMLTIENQIVEKIYQNANSKNRANIKKIKSLIETRKRIYIVLFWPIYEIYLTIFRNEWRSSSFRLFNFKAF